MARKCCGALCRLRDACSLLGGQQASHAVFVQRLATIVAQLFSAKTRLICVSSRALRTLLLRTRCCQQLRRRLAYVRVLKRNLGRDGQRILTCRLRAIEAAGRLLRVEAQLVDYGGALRRVDRHLDGVTLLGRCYVD